MKASDTIRQSSKWEVKYEGFTCLLNKLALVMFPGNPKFVAKYCPEDTEREISWSPGMLPCECPFETWGGRSC